MNLRWSRKALDDLKAVKAYIAKQSKRYAANFVRRIVNRSVQLAQHPGLGWVVPEYGDVSLREIVEHPNRIIYREVPGQIEIVAVVHAARQLPRDQP